MKKLWLSVFNLRAHLRGARLKVTPVAVMTTFAIFTFILTGQAITAAAASKSDGIVKNVSETPVNLPPKRPAHMPEPKVIGPGLPWGPFKLFDDLYYIGSVRVGVFVIETSAGLILIDSGYGLEDCGTMMSDLQKIGLNPKDIKIILLSHEHGDHYGCVREWKNTVCPSAKVGLTQMGWNNLQTWPDKPGRTPVPKPESIDIFLTDGQLVQLGNTTVEIVFTPGHSPGCVSFIFPVRDHGEKHMVGIMGGSGPPPSWEELTQYYASAEYFEQKCGKCDVGLKVHAEQYKDDFEKTLTRQPGEPNPLVIGTERFVTEYIELYKKKAREGLDSLKAQQQEVNQHKQ